MSGWDIALDAFNEAHSEPEKAIALARSWLIIGPSEMTEAEFKRLVVDRIWDLYGDLLNEKSQAQRRTSSSIGSTVNAQPPVTNRTGRTSGNKQAKSDKPEE